MVCRSVLIHGPLLGLPVNMAQVNRNPNKKQLAIDDHCDFLSASLGRTES